MRNALHTESEAVEIEERISSGSSGPVGIASALHEMTSGEREERS